MKGRGDFRSEICFLWSGRVVWSVGDGSGGGEVVLYGGTPRNVWLTHRSHLSMCVRGVYRVLTHTH